MFNVESFKVSTMGKSDEKGARLGGGEVEEVFKVGILCVEGCYGRSTIPVGRLRQARSRKGQCPSSYRY